MKRKCLAVGIILLFVATGIIPATAQNIEKPSQPTSRSNWLYVGGSGPGNYSKIQDAINASSSGDTIYVYNGTYHEAVQVDVELLSIIGEGRDVACIDANYSSAAVVISQSCVSIRRFTIIGKNTCVYVLGGLTHITVSENNLSSFYHSVEFVYEGDNNWNVLENNIFNPTSCGIYLASWYDSGFNTIRNNTFIDNYNGLVISGANNRILNNTFLDCRDSGLKLYEGPSKVEGNIFIGNDIGLEVIKTDYKDSKNNIIRNHFEDNTIGLKLNKAYGTLVTKNNFINNQKHATFYEESRSHGNSWDNNYWSDSFNLFGCTFIFGKVQTGIKKLIQFNPYGTTYYWIPWINLDRDPAQEPYYIP